MNKQHEDANLGTLRSSAGLVGVVGEPTVVEVVRVEDGEGRRRVVARWSDGATGVALSYFADEIHVSEGDIVGKTASELRAWHFTRDRQYLGGGG